MSNAETKTQPTYRVYGVTKNADDTSTWTDIGAAFEHKDGKGLSLMLKARPLDGAQIVLRQPKPGSAEQPKSDIDEASRQTTGRYDKLRTPGSKSRAA